MTTILQHCVHVHASIRRHIVYTGPLGASVKSNDPKENSGQKQEKE